MKSRQTEHQWSLEFVTVTGTYRQRSGNVTPGGCHVILMVPLSLLQDRMMLWVFWFDSYEVTKVIRHLYCFLPSFVTDSRQSTATILDRIKRGINPPYPPNQTRLFPPIIDTGGRAQIFHLN